MARFLNILTGWLCAALLALAPLAALAQPPKPAYVTGSPVTGAIAKASGPQSVTTGDLSGDCTTSGTLNLTCNLPLGHIAAMAANTVIGNATGSSAAPTALALPSCSAATSALTWTSASGFGCNTIAGASISGTPTVGNCASWASATALQDAGVTCGGGGGTSGPWTPVLTFGGGSTGLTYTNVGGYYVQVGKLVTVSFSMQIANKGSSSGTATVSGLPAAAMNSGGSANKFQASGLSYATGLGGGAVGWVAFPGITGGVGNTSFVIGKLNGGSWTAADFTNGAQLIAVFSYLTD